MHIIIFSKSIQLLSIYYNNHVRRVSKVLVLNTVLSCIGRIMGMVDV